MKHPRHVSSDAAAPPKRTAEGDAAVAPSKSVLTKGQWTVPTELAKKPLDGVLRELAGLSWPAARRAIGTGKVLVDGEVVTNAMRRSFAGDVIALEPARPRPHMARLGDLERNIVYVDASVVVVEKPAGVMTVPFGNESPDEARLTLDALIREILAKKNERRGSERGRAPLGVVHRLDKETSGLLVFSRTLEAKKHLSNQFRRHSTKRRYVAIVHGVLDRKQTFRSMLVEDRGDGLRGSSTSRRIGGQLAITHVEPLEALEGATLVSCRLETGRTHQIRIHLSEAGHPLVGESVYIRSYKSPRIPAPRMMLHAIELGFIHPATERPMDFEDVPPPDFQELVERLRRKR